MLSRTKRLAFNILIQGINCISCLTNGTSAFRWVYCWLCWKLAVICCTAFLVYRWLIVVMPSCWSLDGGSSYLDSVPTKLCIFPDQFYAFTIIFVKELMDTENRSIGWKFHNHTSSCGSVLNLETGFKFRFYLEAVWTLMCTCSWFINSFSYLILMPF